MFDENTLPISGRRLLLFWCRGTNGSSSHAARHNLIPHRSASIAPAVRRTARIILLVSSALVAAIAVGAQEPSPELVRSVQMRLIDLGYEPGVPDGIVGPNTTAAVRAFQKDQGLAETGELTGELLGRLETAVETHGMSQPTGGASSDSQLGPASPGGEAMSGQSAGDLDGDGLSNELELQLGTDPENADTDGDGIPDGMEIAQGKDPLAPEVSQAVAEVDSDGDGLADHVELTLGTNPNNPDSDGDGIPDRDDESTYEKVRNEEQISEAVETASDPASKIERWLETAERVAAFYASLKGLLAGPEDGPGSSHPQDYYSAQESYPGTVDSDGDGIPDDEEIAAGSDPNDPTSLPQYASPQESYPPMVDSDGDGYPDEEELAAGSDPNDPTSRPDYAPPPPVSQATGGGDSGGTTKLNVIGSSMAFRHVRIQRKLLDMNKQLERAEGELDSGVSSSLREEWRDILEQLGRIQREMQK